MTTDLKKFTPVMLELIEQMKKHGGAERHAGGFWCCGGLSMANSFGTSTVEAVVRRGVAEYVEWREGRRDRFPIKARLLAQGNTNQRGITCTN